MALNNGHHVRRWLGPRVRGDQIASLVYKRPEIGNGLQLATPLYEVMRRYTVSVTSFGTSDRFSLNRHHAIPVVDRQRRIEDHADDREVRGANGDRHGHADDRNA
jgi:hypothetical protein